jgi:hypothetical protein
MQKEQLNRFKFEKCKNYKVGAFDINKISIGVFKALQK